MVEMRSLTDTSILVITDRATLKGNLLHITVSGTTNGSLLRVYVESLVPRGVNIWFEALLRPYCQGIVVFSLASASSLHGRLKCQHKGIQRPAMHGLVRPMQYWTDLKG